MGSTGSVHIQKYYPLNKEYDNPEIAEKMDQLVNIKKDVLKALEFKRKEKVIGTSIEADLAVFVKSDIVRKMLMDMGDEAKRFFQVSSITVVDTKTEGMEDFENSSLSVKKSVGTKCVRCWNYSDGIGSDEKHPELCPRCTSIIRKIMASG